jgi:phytoene dehydrogenase-like protein
MGTHSKPKKVVVIGSGVGGAGVAALLQARGHQVTLLEKNAYYGGKCWTFHRNGFLVDSGVHMFSMGESGQHGDINRRVKGDLAWLTADPGEYLLVGGKRFVPLYQNIFDPRSVWHNFRLLAGSTLDRLRNRNRNRCIDRRDLERELHWASRLGSLPETLHRLFRLARFDPGVFLELDDMSLRDFLHLITGDPVPLQGLAALSMLLTVVPYHEVSAGEFLWCMVNIFRKRTLGVPRGGSREIPGAFLRALLRDGGEMKLGCEVKRILVEEGRARGVETTEGEEIYADVVVSNAGIKKTLELAGEENFPREYVSYVKGLRCSYSFITVKYGLSRRVVDLPAPSFFNIPDVDPDHMFDYLERGGVPEDPFLFAPMPSEWDPYAAPPGKQLIIVGVPGPIEVNKDNVEQCEKILDRAEERFLEIFPRVESHIEWKMRTHIAHTASITGKPTGECIGLAQCVGQTGVNKPVPWTPVEGLWLVGADAGARGVGTEQAAGSALYVAGLLG